MLILFVKFDVKGLDTNIVYQAFYVSRKKKWKEPAYALNILQQIHNFVSFNGKSAQLFPLWDVSVTKNEIIWVSKYLQQETLINRGLGFYWSNFKSVCSNLHYIYIYHIVFFIGLWHLFPLTIHNHRNHRVNLLVSI